MQVTGVRREPGADMLKEISDNVKELVNLEKQRISESGALCLYSSNYRAHAPDEAREPARC